MLHNSLQEYLNIRCEGVIRSNDFIYDKTINHKMLNKTSEDASWIICGANIDPYMHLTKEGSIKISKMEEGFIP